MSADLSVFKTLGISPLIAARPAEPRDSSRLLVINRNDSSVKHSYFRCLPDFLKPGDCIIINKSSVWKAKIYAVKNTGGKTEFLLMESIGGNLKKWNLLCRKISEKASYTLNGGAKAECLSRNPDGSYLFEFSEPLTEKYLNAFALVPLPGYIEKKRKEEKNKPGAEKDEIRYQTIYAEEKGSIAAPTAGFHFTEELMGKIREMGASFAEITLHIGWGTFKPIRGSIEEHRMLPEFCSVSEKTAEELNSIKKAGGRLIAVGTSSIRTLESLSDENGEIRAGTAKTEIFIYPGYKFKVPDCFITNLHVPDSPPLAMTAAFCGTTLLFRAYKEAVESGYRFYSYGDSTLII